MANFAPITEAGKKDDMIVERVFCIYYSVWFKKNEEKALINFGNEVNIMTSEYTSKLGLKICSTDIRAQKIDRSTLKIFKIVLASFQIEVKLELA